MHFHRIERAIFVGLSVLMLFLAIIFWVAVHQAGPPPMISTLFTILPFVYITTLIDSLARLHRWLRLVIRIITSIFIIIFLSIAIATLFGWQKGGLVIPFGIAIFLSYYNLRINPWWSKRVY